MTMDITNIINRYFLFFIQFLILCCFSALTAKLSYHISFHIIVPFIIAVSHWYPPYSLFFKLNTLWQSIILSFTNRSSLGFVGGGRNRTIYLISLRRIRYLYYECVVITASLVLLAPGPGQAPEAFAEINDLPAIFLSLKELKEIFGLTVY